MRIAVISQDGQGDFAPPHDGPWRQFFSAIETRGHRIVSHRKDPEVIIFMNNHSKLVRKVMKQKSKTELYLVLWEPRATHPENFSKENRLHYRKIFSPSSEWISGKNVVTFNWPQGEPRMKELDEEEWYKRINEPSIFQSNKYSFFRGEKYSQRRKFIKKYKDYLYVYGRDWNAPIRSSFNLTKALMRALHNFHSGLTLRQKPIWIKLQNYCGYASDKDAELSKFKFTIVIENSNDYVSEKLFEGIRNGCIVFYEGPNLANFGIPSDIVVNCRDILEDFEKTYSNLLKDSERCFEIAQAAVRFHNSNDFTKMLNMSALRELGDLVCDSLESDNHD